MTTYQVICYPTLNGINSFVFESLLEAYCFYQDLNELDYDTVILDTADEVVCVDKEMFNKMDTSMRMLILDCLNLGYRTLDFSV